MTGEDGRQAGETCCNYWLLLGESHLARRLFTVMVRRIVLLPSPVG